MQSATSGSLALSGQPPSFDSTILPPAQTTILCPMKLEPPKFDGSDPHGWVFRIEEFFDFHNTPEPLRLRIIAFHLEGRASSWKDFLQKLLLHFGASLYEDHQGKLSKLAQSNTVAEFQTEFKDLMNKIMEITEPLLISFFITGLKLVIRLEILMSRPSSLMESFAVARAIAT